MCRNIPGGCHPFGMWGVWARWSGGPVVSLVIASARRRCPAGCPAVAGQAIMPPTSAHGIIFGYAARLRPRHHLRFGSARLRFIIDSPSTLRGKWSLCCAHFPQPVHFI